MVSLYPLLNGGWLPPLILIVGREIAAAVMKNFVLPAVVVVVLVGAVMIVRLLQQNHALQSRVSGLTDTLTEVSKSADSRVAELSALRSTIAQLQDDLTRATQALNVMATSKVDAPTLSAGSAEPEPLGLTTNDVDLAGMFVVGTNTVGTLFVPLRGKVVHRRLEIHTRRQPFVFGKMLSDTNGWTGLGAWKRDGTNVEGIAIHFNSTAEAEAFAGELRAQASQ